MANPVRTCNIPAYKSLFSLLCAHREVSFGTDLLTERNSDARPKGKTSTSQQFYHGLQQLSLRAGDEPALFVLADEEIVERMGSGSI